MTQWFEDIELDVKHDLGTHTFSEVEIIRFASAYDPQYFHISPDQAPHSHFDGIIASGWHTACIGHRLLVEAIFDQKSKIEADGGTAGEAGPSPGVNQMVFKTPVRPGDTVRYSFSVESKRPSRSLKGWGLLLQRLEAHNQRDELVYSAQIAGFVRLRDYVPTFGQRLQQWAISKPVLRPILSRLAK